MLASTFYLLLLSLGFILSPSQASRFLSQNIKAANMLNAFDDVNYDARLATMDDYSAMINNLFVFGDWKTSSQILRYFNFEHGLMSLKGLSSSTEESGQSWIITTSLYDGPYTNEKYAQFHLNILNPSQELITDYKNATFSLQNTLLTIGQGYSRRNGDSMTCLSNLTFYFIDTKQNGPMVNIYPDYKKNLGVQISIESSQCSLALLSPVLKDAFPASVSTIIIYVATVIIANIINVISVKKIITALQKSRYGYDTLSNWSLLALNVWDTYLVLFHLVATKEFSVWFVCSAVVMLFTLNAPGSLLMFLTLSDQDEERRSQYKRRCFLVALYYACFGSLLYMMFVLPTAWRNMLPAAFLLPQIILTLCSAKHYNFTGWYEIGITLGRLSWIVYLNLYTDNIFRNSPNVLFVISFIGLVLLQISILLLQTRYPRFFWTIKPFRYTLQPKDLEEKTDICPICIEPLLKNDLALSQKLLEEEDTRRRTSTKVYRTPCRHNFHNKCLKRWVEQKFECPFCRQSIPSISL